MGYKYCYYPLKQMILHIITYPNIFFIFSITKGHLLLYNMFYHSLSV